MRNNEPEHIRALTELAGGNAVRTGSDATAHLTDWRGRHKGKAMAVVLPASTEDVARVVRYCRENRIAVFPQGGNTSLCAGSVPPEDDRCCIVLSTDRLRRLREIDAAADVAIVEAGVTLAALHDAAESAGRLFPLRLGSEGTAQIGGLISTNAGGTGAVRYGVMRDLVLGLEAVLPDGSVVSRLGGLRKDNRGYDWKHLMIGGEGSLGIVTAAAVKLFPAVRDSAHAACIVSDPDAAVALLQRLRARFDTAIHAFELVSGGEIDLALRHVEGLRAPFTPTPPWIVMIELGSSDSEAGLDEKLTGFLGRVLSEGMIEDAVIPASGQQVNELWAVRHSLSEANKKAGHGIVFDVAVRISDVPRFIRESTQIVKDHTPLADPVFVCHLGDGNVHLIAMIPREVVPASGILEPLVHGLQDKVHDLAERLGGSFSAEHGIGRKLADEMARRLPPAEMRLMHAIKQALDPHGVFAPDVLLTSKAESEPARMIADDDQTPPR
ncbi:FAD-binding oxidoreductase [Aquicoccus porphyridii]|uniref:FAD-binding oxidoreductase n=1 Tax=Aquicoccus porphyridii TaxID=1852029 RepID=A0A5A9ZJM6_9RHOB|nr:FAD-binding oxidoreductase [Aquicoccus porphyridii]KAA0917513.1 FAD-binding oxidoreductase [Aquicoccus porphyridii]RAI55595.1 hypothetical protein DOO74_04075 [Rhodobacteraceae bacterium AsT-22]